MYEKLTSILEDNSEFVKRFGHELSAIIETNPGYGWNRYGEILESHGIKWDPRSMKMADVSKLSGRTVIALLMGAVRAERIFEGTFKEFLEDGDIEKWLTRLKRLTKREILWSNSFLLKKEI